MFRWVFSQTAVIHHFKMTTLNKYKLTAETIKFTPSLQFDSDLLILDTETEKSEFDRTTYLTITDDKGKTIKIRIDWCNFSTTDTDFSTLIISETDKLFFGARFFWGIIDLKNIKIEKQENCVVFWNFEKHSNTIVVISELSAESMNFKGEFIDKVPIDPPFDSKDFDDRIEFNSPVYGQQTLKLMK